MSVRNALLGLLAQKPRHGYELHAALQAVVGGEENWDVKRAQIYTTLARLEESGLIAQESIEQDGGPEKRIYAITPPGLAELESWFISSVEPEHQRDEFFLKLMISLVVEQINPYQVIQRQRAKLYQELHNLTARRSKSNAKTELARILLFDKAIMHLEADLRWLDMIEGRLDEIQRQPMPEPEVKPRGRPRGNG